MLLSVHEMLEVVYLYEPLGAPKGERELHGGKVICRAAHEAEFSELDTFSGSLRLLVATAEQIWDRREALTRRLESTEGAHLAIFLVEDSADAPTVRLRKRLAASPLHNAVLGDLKYPYSVQGFIEALNNACSHFFLRVNQNIFQAALAIRDAEARSINEVGHAIMTGQASLDDLMRLVLEKAVELTCSDAGFLLLRENLLAEPVLNENGARAIRKLGSRFVQKFRICRSQNVRLQTKMLDPQLSPFTSLVVNRGDAIAWTEGAEKPCFYSTGDLQFPAVDVSLPEVELDQRSYALKSYCAFPLRTPSAELVGLLFLVNRRIANDVYCDNLADVENRVIGFSDHDLSLLGSLANQAGVSIDHARLYRDMRNLFESFVQASVYAIESRDPTTKGHSERVALMTVGLAEAVSRETNGPYGNIIFNPGQIYEIKYAALLHDFGKIGVQEHLLQKEKKLFPHELGMVQARFMALENRIRATVLESYLEALMKRNEAPRPEDYQKIRLDMDNLAREFGNYWALICDANEPNVVSQEAFEKIAGVAAQKILLGTEEVSLLTESEVGKLSIRKGSLAPDERREIESHVTHSYRFLVQIPWSSELANVPDIVHAHHERLDGSGYPRGLVDARDEFPLQAKIMAITDIFDALVARDRPYKKALPPQRAFSILEAEVKEGKLDRDLFEIFLRARIADLILASNVEVA